MTKRPPRHRCGPNERAIGSEPAGPYHRAAGMGDRGVAINFGLGRSKERLAEAQGNRTSNAGQLEIEEAGNGPDRPAHQRTGATDYVDTCLLGRAPRDGPDSRARCLGFKAAMRPAGTQPPIGHNIEVTNVASIPPGAVEEAAVEHDATSNTR